MDDTSFQSGGQEQQTQTPVQDSVQSPVAPLPMEMTSMPKKTFTPKFIGVIVLLLVLGAGAYGAMWYQQKQQVAQEVVPIFTPRPSATPDPTADWKTHTNSQYGFEFKYPGDLILHPVVDGVEISLPPDTLRDLLLSVSLDGRIISEISDQYAKIRIPLKDIFVNGIPAIQPENTGNIFIVHDNKVYKIIYNEVNNPNKLVDQILSTFKFTK